MVQLPISIVMLGATGAVGGHVLRTLLSHGTPVSMTLLGRSIITTLETTDTNVDQHIVDVLEVDSYRQYIPGHQIAVCTLGVGQPSKVSKEHFISIDKKAVQDFALVCKKNGVRHFELLSSVGADSNSSSFYLKTKGELIDYLKSLEFERLSIFQPSMILTPENRYGWTQGIALALWPKLNWILNGSWRKYRGIEVENLGRAMGLNIFTSETGFEQLHWDEFYEILESGSKTEQL